MSVLKNTQVNSTFLRYGLVTVLSYVLLLSGTALLVEVFSADESLAYASTLALVYIGVYLSSSVFVFKASDHRAQWYKFVSLIAVFWLLNTYVFNALIGHFSIHYLQAACLNILIFGPLRYFINKRWVFNTR